MRKIVKGDILKEKMLEAIDMLCGSVKTTLGPKGTNVIIDHSDFSPFITNDGVTIAENIESDDETVRVILELAKEASIKTNEMVGDGTTTTLVLLESIYKEGIKLISEGINPLILKDELNKSLNTALNLIDQENKTVKDDDLYLIASNSANDEIVGKNVSNAFLKVKNKNSITIKEGTNNFTQVNYIKGYTFDTVIASPYFFKNGNIYYDKPYILLINDVINDIQDIVDTLNFIIENKQNLVIIAKDYSEDVINTLLSLFIDENINISLLKNPEFGMREYYFINDIKVILDNGFKQVKSIKIAEENTTIIFDMNQNIKEYINNLEKIKSNNEIDELYLKEKISMFQNGIAEIIVGANTSLERRELKMRYEDALSAVSSCVDGILPGGGIIYYKVSNLLKKNSLGNKVLISSLTKPLEQLLINSGNEMSIFKVIKDNNFNLLYNIKLNEFESIHSTKIIEPTSVVKSALTNAVSIASMLLTTNSLVINELENNKSKNLFNEI